jgi:Zn-finger nucleic acid-binding protein
MKCPLCDVYLLEEDREGLALASCPECGGAWVERAELERILHVLHHGPGQWPEENLGHHLAPIPPTYESLLD